jgi:ribonuclease-3
MPRSTEASSDNDTPAPQSGFEALWARLSPYINDKSLMRTALVHRSYCAEARGEESNERLEFLGDAVLGLLVTERLYRSYPHLPEGDLARIRSAVVSAEALAPVAAELGVGEALFLGRGEARSGGKHKPSLLANALEAIIGAAYLGAGEDGARRLVEELLSAVITAAAGKRVLGDPKNHLQELAAQLGAPRPAYQLSNAGPDHAKHFVAEVSVGDVRGRGEGRSKKHAERAAAANAIASLEARDASFDA